MVVLSGFDALLPLNDLVEQYREEYNLDDIPQPVWDAATIDGNIYGVPFMSNTMHLFYRSDIFEAHGHRLCPPPTMRSWTPAPCWRRTKTASTCPSP